MAAAKDETREIMFHCRMTDLEREMLEQLAEEDGQAASVVVRALIRQAHRARFPEDYTRRGKR
jgi:hypothetical protein